MSDGPRRSISFRFATCFGTVARGVRGKRGVSAVNSLSVSYTGRVGVQIWGGQKLERWHDEGPRGYTVTPAPSSSSPTRCVNSERGWVCVCVLICVFSLRDLSSVMLPQWKPAFDLFKKRVMPTSCYPQACQVFLRGEGPHNLLFVPLLLRKYFLNSFFSVYFYYSCFLPWFTPILSYLFVFQTPVWFIMANLPQKDFKKLLLSWLWTVFICLGEPEGERVFRGYLCGGDSWAESYKLTPIVATSGPNQIPLLQIADMWTDMLSSDVLIYQPGPATLNVKTFLHRVKLMRCYVHGVRCVKWFLSVQGAHLTANVTQRDQTLIYSQLWHLCLLMFGRVCAAFSTANPHAHANHQGKKEWKGEVTGWPLIHDSALKNSAFKSNCPVWRPVGGTVVPWAARSHRAA